MSPLQPAQALLSHPVLDPALTRGCAEATPIAGPPTPVPASLDGPDPLSAMLPGFSASACPGLLTRAAVPRQQPAKGQGRGRGGWGWLWSPSSPSPSTPATTEARSPPTDRELRMPPPAPAPKRLGPGGLLTSLRDLPRWPIGLRDGASTQPGKTMEKTVCGSSLEPHPQRLWHPQPSPCRSLLPASLQKGTEIKPGFLTLTRVVGKGWRDELQPPTTQTTSHGSKTPLKAQPPWEICDPTFKISTEVAPFEG